MSDPLFVYLIVALNAGLQAMLIGRLKLSPTTRRRHQIAAIAVPVFVMLATRLAIAGGLMHERVDAQSGAERWVTLAAGIVLLGGPVLVTLSALVARLKGR